MNRNVTVAFDVMGTLVDHDGNPYEDAVDLYKKFENLGCTMVIWSGGGRDLAARTARKLNLQPNVVCTKCCKMQPDIVVDDDTLMAPFGKVFIKV